MNKYKIEHLTMPMIRKIRKNNSDFNIFFNENKGFIHNLALKFMRKDDDRYNDLFQVGCMSMCKALERYSPKRSAFSTFAWHVIMNDLKQEIKKYSKHAYQENSMEDDAHSYDKESHNATDYQESNWTPFMSKTVDVETQIVNELSKEQLLKTLTPLEQQIAALRMEKYTKQEISKMLNKKKSTVHEIMRYLVHKPAYQELMVQ